MWVAGEGGVMSDSGRVLVCEVLVEPTEVNEWLVG